MAQWENVEHTHDLSVGCFAHTHDMGCCDNVHAHELVYTPESLLSADTISSGVYDTDEHSHELVFGIVDEGVLGSVTTKLNLYNELVALYEKIKTCKHITDENKFMMMLDVIREIKDINR